ncbi:hypothetical protein CORC01_10756 [Colletotrichum orchidophilum]|uniref:Uncharacterized protein n=1 Tax=Colletotrichum orchidophilum TaxID=1209926 RepID=A0A1G4AXT4_9PEZI|nr:uncharacterized protein CORC01_10756 [Colletotrichum orchidophilum]OHE93969.1 hypothetical protein CORC01_10756 [Colletotrichum orchidophilum]
MLSSKVYSPPDMERSALQLQDLQELQKQHNQQMQEVQQQQQQQQQQQRPQGVGEIGGGFAQEVGRVEPTPTNGGERPVRNFNYNGRVRNSERASERASSGVLGRQHPHRSSFSIYSNYSSYSSSSSSDGGGGGGVRGSVPAGAGGEGGGPTPPPPLPRQPTPTPYAQQPQRNPMMEMVPPQAPGTAETDATAVAGTESVKQQQQQQHHHHHHHHIRHPPPTYAPSSQDPYSRVRFADEERRREKERRREEEASHPPGQIDMAQIAGGHSMRALWVFACCAFFWYRCLMDEDY